MNALRAVSVEYLTMLKMPITAEVKACFRFIFSFLSAHKPTPRKVALVALSALRKIFQSNSLPVGFLPQHKRSAYTFLPLVKNTENDRLLQHLARRRRFKLAANKGTFCSTICMCTKCRLRMSTRVKYEVKSVLSFYVFAILFSPRYFHLPLLKSLTHISIE
jgi:hypothetical protein